MPDLLAIGQGLSALKAATEIVKTLVGLRDSAKLLEKTIELNQKILSAQTALADAQTEQTTLSQTIRQLEEEVTRFKNWEAEKQRYELKQVSYVGSTAYVVKPEAKGSEPPHCICAACYQNAKKRILQPTMVLESGQRLWQCPECDKAIIVTSPLHGYAPGA